MMTRTHIVAFILSLFVSAVSTPLIRKYARKHNLMDSPEDPRKVHETPTPRLGGIAIALGFWTPLVALLIYSNDISVILFAEPNMLSAGIFAVMELIQTVRREGDDPVYEPGIILEGRKHCHERFGTVSRGENG